MAALRAAAAAVLALVPAAGPALAAGDPPGARVTAVVTPADVAPGGDVDVRVEGCAGPGGTVRSEAFVADAQLSGRTGGGTGALHGDTTVRSGTATGTYPLTVVCAGRDHRGAGRVHVEPAPPPSPHAPVRAGGGGAAMPAPNMPSAAEWPTPDMPSVAERPVADAPGVAEQGPGTRHTVIGLVLAAAAAVAVAVRSARRRRRGPGTDRL
ncbi:hypothetical protein [Streptomyces roseolilacinus]|uniref:hypothetical protein n=1 Tax=Streptomyces roseolilacinus TaxID=66904 RepID=UPI0038018097